MTQSPSDPSTESPSGESHSRTILTESDGLAKSITGFSPRESQVLMAEKIAETIEAEGKLVVEADTGTGKTFAYLVPILLSNKKVVISTGTKNLQDQLFHRDLPTLLNALNVSLPSALLKGRANYLCRYRLQLSMDDGRFQSRQTISDLQDIARWSMTTATGDISEMTDIAEDAEVWPFATSTADNCLNQDCPMIDSCCVVQARKKAMEADLVVVNHHLFFADASLKGERVGELLPGVDVVVFDEAHQLHDTASAFFGQKISGRQLLELSKDTWVETLQEASDMGDLIDLAKQLEKDVLDFRLAFGEETSRGAWFEVSEKTMVQDAIAQMKSTLAHISAQLLVAAPRSKGLAACSERAEELTKLFTDLTAAPAESFIHWFETFSKTFTIYLTPLSVATEFRDYLTTAKCSWIFTSATLSMDTNFSHFTDALGLEDCEFLQLPSPFNYPEQGLFYVPRSLPDPSDRDYTEAVVKAAIPVLKASAGRAFMLFTSHRALQIAADLLKDEVEFPLFVQGTMGKNELITQFRDAGNGVLLGTGSFWEGVDVRGDALSVVIIDKLPFSSPGDPVEKARIDSFRKGGRNPFMDYQMPAAVIALKQGAGRLIRDEQDKGILMVCDPRIVSKHYGAEFVKSLPDLHRTRQLNLVEEFLANLS